MDTESDRPINLDRVGVIARPRGSDLATFSPPEAKIRIAKADAIIEMASKLRDWPLLEDAIDSKIAEQQEFVRWWRETVTARHGLNRHTVENADRGSLSSDDAESLTGISQQQVSRWGKRLAKEGAYRVALFQAAWRKAMAEKGQTEQRGASGTGENEWYTPAEYLAAARDVLGGIDLDPASSMAAQEKVKAERFFTKEDDGLAQEWHGRIWLNPPYAQPAIAHFVSKMVSERSAGRVRAAILLTHNYTDTAWFHEAATSAAAICFTRGRIKFFDAAGTIAAPTQGQAFFYFGSDDASFSARFARVGFIVRPWHGEA